MDPVRRIKTVTGSLLGAGVLVILSGVAMNAELDYALFSVLLLTVVPVYLAVTLLTPRRRRG